MAADTGEWDTFVSSEALVGAPIKDSGTYRVLMVRQTAAGEAHAAAPGEYWHGLVPAEYGVPSRDPTVRGSVVGSFSLTPRDFPTSPARACRVSPRGVLRECPRYRAGAVTAPLQGGSRSDVAPFQRIRKAYEQVADQMRELILAGDLAPGEQLPNEQTLANDFGVSRATVREALRVLSTQSLLRTAKGAGGSSYVTRPSVDHISEFLCSNIGLLSQSQGVTLEEFLEAREYLEVPAARLAAVRRSEEGVQQLAAAIPEHPATLDIQEQCSYSKDFHSLIVQLSANTLLEIATQPVFSVLQHNLARSTLGNAVHQHINDDHRKILDAIRNADPDSAEHAMREHLAFLRPQYERAWKHARK
jgi:DNA-binding FadR family transcriptional regulator